MLLAEQAALGRFRPQLPHFGAQFYIARRGLSPTHTLLIVHTYPRSPHKAWARWSSGAPDVPTCRILQILHGIALPCCEGKACFAPGG